MKRMQALLILLFLCVPSTVAIAQEPGSGKTSSFDPDLARKLGADERGMKTYVLCILKTGPNDAKVLGKDREDVFAGHFANIGRLAKEGKLG